MNVRALLDLAADYADARRTMAENPEFFTPADIESALAEISSNFAGVLSDINANG